jgi:L-ribulose-5-phosphate 4-epimerase
MFLNFKKLCHNGNLKISKSHLSFQNFGNVSLRINNDLFTIKPSGVDLTNTDYKKYPLISIKNKLKKKNYLKSSVDTDFHLEIYKYFHKINSIVHTHSKYATIWAQACKNIPVLGTTHADFWSNEIEVTDTLKIKEIENNYEKNIGKSIIKKMKLGHFRGLLIAHHGAIAFGENIDEAIKNAERLEFVAELAYKTLKIKIQKPISQFLVDKHFARKNGNNKYYGQ